RWRDDLLPDSPLQGAAALLPCLLADRGIARRIVRRVAQDQQGATDRVPGAAMKRARRVRLGLALLDDPLRALLQRVGIPVLQAPAPGEVDGDLVGKRPPRTVLVLGADLDPVFRPRVGAEAYPMGAGPLPAGRPLWPVQLDGLLDVPAIEPDLVVMRVRRAAVVPVIRWRPFSAGIRADCPGQLDAVQDCDRVEVRPSPIDAVGGRSGEFIRHLKRAAGWHGAGFGRPGPR